MFAPGFPWKSPTAEGRVLPPAFKAKTEMLVILPSNYDQVFLNALRQQTMS